jgi:glycosyltransferase involved in cell wall biosynthesis
MRILLCAPTPWNPRLGAAKVFIELSEELTALGWECERICLPELVTAAPGRPSVPLYAEALRRHLRERAGDFDVVEYDHAFLPFPRSEFPGDTLFVARSVLLLHHVAAVEFPVRRTLRTEVGSLVHGAARRREFERMLHFANRTVAEADLVNVSNNDACDELRRRGLSGRKIVVLPYGLTRSRRDQLEAVPSTPPAEPVVAFVGTFDFRKGATDFPRIVEAVSTSVPEARFRLIGTEGMHTGIRQVHAFFARRLRARIEVAPRFEPEGLPELLAGCSVGVFPSYAEGFPFGVLEMLAASVPVVAYRAPGAPMMLPPEYLVAPGDTGGMGRRVAGLLSDDDQLTAARIWARQRSRDFSWPRIAVETARIYTAAVGRLRAGVPSPSAPGRASRTVR